MKTNTRQKIIDLAIERFNESSYAGVSLQELANHLEITRGNLTYHFKDKESLLKAICEEMWQKLELRQVQTREFPSFENLHNFIRFYYQVQKEYSFIFLDQHVLNHPILKDKFREMTQRGIEANNAAIAFSIRLGNMQPEPFPGLYHNIAFLTWMLSFYWLNQQTVRGEEMPNFESGEKMLWSILLPHFTEKGVQAFINFFGEDYHAGLGEPFRMDPQDITIF